jgi:hypothetical protein
MKSFTNIIRGTSFQEHNATREVVLSPLNERKKNLHKTCQSKHNNVVHVILLYYIRRATCFDSPESSSGPQGLDPYNKWGKGMGGTQCLQ